MNILSILILEKGFNNLFCVLYFVILYFRNHALHSADSNTHPSRLKGINSEGFNQEDLYNLFNRDKRAATARPERVWDYAVIPYEIDANFSGVHKALFKQESVD